MKRSFTILTAAFMLLAFLAIPMGMMGQTRDVESFTFSELGYGNAEDVTTVAGDDVTLTFAAGTNASNSPKYYNTGAGVRMYAGNTLEVALNNQTSDTRITAIDFTFSGSSYSGGLQNWTGSETSHTFTATGTARIQVIAVTFADGGTPTPTTYTVTYDCNGGTNGCPENVTGIEAGEEITLADAPTKDGFDFDGWNDGNNTYEAGDEYTVNGNVTFTAQWTEVVSSDVHWVLTDLANLTSSDVFVIVGNNGSNYAMSNDNGTDPAPSAVAVTVTGNEITSTVAANIQWNISGNATNGYTFYPNGSTTTWLYCTNTNNGVRVGTNANKTFVVDHNYLKHISTSRYVGVYNSQDWRCYTSYTATNIANQTFAFYKKVTGEILPPSITAANVDIEYNATSGSITYTINNDVEGGALTATTESNWLTLGEVGTTVPFTCTANEASTARTATVTLTYTYNRETVTKDVTVTQAAAPVIYTTIPALYTAATSTATDVIVTFGGWVVSAVNNSNAYLTDNQGHGLIIYASEHGFQVNDVLTGTANCKLQTYRGSAELTNLTTSSEGLNVANNGTVTEQNIAISELGGVNTGALLAYQGLTYNGTALIDSDNNTITPYSTLYSYTFENGKTYNVKGIYLQYNSTKEILPRSADDIEEVQVPHNEYTLTVSNLSHVNLFIFGGDESETIISTEDGETTAQVYDGTNVEISVDVESGYVLQSLVVDGEDVTNQIDSQTEMYVFTMPAHDVIITATAEVLTGDNYELYSGALVEGDYLIVYNGKAMNNTTSSNRLQYAEVTAYNNVITTDNAAIVWHIAPSGEYWTIYSADAEAYAASTGTKNQATTMADGTDDKALWTVSDNYDFVNKYNSANNINSYLRNNGTYGFACYATSTGGALSLYKKVEDTPATYTLTINGYGDSEGGYYLIASPVTVNPSTNSMTTGDYDLYSFNQAEEDEWRNYKAGAFTSLEPGQGYLYAHKTGGDFTLSGEAYTGDGTITLTKTEGGDFPGWNLVGNPFGTSAQINRDYYIMNPANGKELIESSGLIAAMQGVFVIATSDEETLTFESVGGESANPMPEDKKVVLNIFSNSSITTSMAIDRAVVRFGEGRTLPKFQLNPDNTKVYFTEGNQDFAVVRSANEGEMPVSFKASENGRYTISVNAENIEMEYLHLIDNMTGANVDLLATPSYSFEANTTDYTSRFRLVFSANNGISEQNNETFAFFNGSNWVVNNEGEATLQVIDMTGRMLSSEQINGSYNKSLNLSAGVYVLRLSNGNVVKTQKVVID